MKINYLYKITGFLLVGIFITACDLFDLDVNEDPNNPPLAAPDLILASAIVNGSSTFGDGINNATHGWTRITDSFDSYNMSANSWNGTWNSLYAGPLKDLRDLKEVTSDGSSPHYYGVAQILEAFYFSIMIDMWGDVPFNEAFQGDAETQIKSASFDDAQTLYAQLIQQIDAGIAELAKTSPVSVGGDPIYGGDVTKWTTFANSLKLKMLLNLTQVDPSYSNQLNTMASSGNLIDDPSEYFVFRFNSSLAPDDRHPWYVATYGGDDNSFSYIGHQFMLEMLVNNDPRVPYYFLRQITSTLDPENPTDKQTIPCSQRTDCDYGYFPLSNFVNQALYGEDAEDTADPVDVDYNGVSDAIIVTLYRDEGEPVDADDRLMLLDDGTVITASTPGLVNYENVVNDTLSTGETAAVIDRRGWLSGYFGRDHGDPSGIPLDGALRTALGVYPAGGIYDRGATKAGGNNGTGNGVFPMLTGFMVKFHRIEAMLTNGATGNPRAELESAIREHMAYVESISQSIDANSRPMESGEVDDYVNLILAKYDAASDDDARLNVVLEQAWFSNFGNGIEIYNAYRRTGYPSDLQVALQPVRDFPLRLPYTLDEVNLNGSNVPEITYDVDPIFWDIN